MPSAIKVLCSGNIAVDFYRQAGRISLSKNFQEQALGEHSEMVFLGGKAMNFASNFSQCGIRTWFHGSVGNDAFGNWAISEAESRGISTEFVVRSAAPTMAFGIDENAQDFIPELVYKDHASLVLPTEELKDDVLSEFDCVVLHATSAWDDLEVLCNKLGRTSAYIVFNPAPNFNLKSLDPLSASDVIVANKIEANKVLLMINKNKGQSFVDQKLAEEIGKFFGKTCIVTLGGDGVIAYDGKKTLGCSVRPSQIVDTVGAGDGFLGYAIASILQGADIGSAMRIGQVAAGLICEQRGAYREGLSYEDVKKESDKIILTELSL